MRMDVSKKKQQERRREDIYDIAIDIDDISDIV